MRSPRPAPGDGSPAAGSASALTFSARPAAGVTLAGVLIILMGFAFAGPTLAVTGAALIVLGLACPLWVLGVAVGVRLDGRPLEATVVEGRPLSVEITVSGRRPLGLGGAALEHQLLSEPLGLTDAARDAARARRGGSGPRRRWARTSPDGFLLTARAQGRGRLEIAPPRLVVSDPLGLARAARRSDGTPGSLLVLPRTEPVRWLDADLRKGSVQSRLGVAAMHGVDIAGLRDYQVGTPASRIHWPTLARGGPLVERVFATETELAPLVVVDPRLAGPGGDPAVLDVVVRGAASLVLSIARTQAVDLLLPGAAVPMTVTPSLSAWPAAHRALALIQPAPRSFIPPNVPAGGQGVMFYVCCDRMLAAAAQHRWAGELLTVIPVGPAGAGVGPRLGAVLEVAGCIAVPVRTGA